MLDLSLVAADLKLVITAEDDRILRQGSYIRRRLKVSEKLWTILLTDFVDLSKLAVVEENMISTTVDTLDVHPQGHDDLEVRVLRLVIPHSDLNCFV